MPAKWIQALLLFLLLGMPITLYLFLQGFGENVYNIPVFYENGIPDPIAGCTENPKPHLINEFVNEGPCQLWNCADIEEKFVIFSFIKDGCDSTHFEEIARVCNVYRNQILFKAITVLLDSEVSAGAMDQNARLYGFSQDVWSWWPYHQAVTPLVQCGFNLSMDCISAGQVVLVDNLFQIRGYYLASDPEEMDRLVVELNLLFGEADSRTSP